MANFNDAFWKWFGDSKVVDSRGNPLVVYHGSTSNKPFDKFRIPKYPVWGDSVLGIFFSSEEGVARSFAEGGWVASAYLRVENPKVINPLEFYGMINELGSSDFRSLRRDLIKSGYDGIIIPQDSGINRRYGPGWIQFDADQIIVFRPAQIKDAINNDGSWDLDDPRIRSNPRRRR